MRVLTKALLYAGLCGVLMGCADAGTALPELEYTVGGCTDESEASRGGVTSEVEITGGADSIHVEQSLTYVCCAELELSLEQDGNTLRITETNVGEVCRCICEYSIVADVTGLDPGEYDVEVWGVEYEDLHTPELLEKAQVTLGEGSR
jgi:hypothetical protein